MAKTENISLYECDRCGEKYYAIPGDEYAKGWSQPTRESASGAKSSPCLCPLCTKDYKSLLAAQDEMYAKWINEKRG